MDRRVLIVENQNDFALSMASVLKGAGYQTALAEDGAEAQRELEKRRPDLVVLRAELPDQSGFVLCGHIKRGKFGHNLPVLLLTSEVGEEGLAQHAKSSNAADGYLSIPFEMGELLQLAAAIAPAPVNAERDELDLSIDSALDGTPHAAGDGNPEQASPTPPPLRTAGPAGPPRLPKRERRSAITEEDRSFLDRAFQSIADRKAELLAESRQLKRPTPRRDLMSSPEGKVQILREELKVREAQVARISEIWAVRERELLSVEDRLHEKDVEVQGLKMQVDDLARRFNDLQQSMTQKEREHGATVDDLLLQRFANEKDLIEVVAAKEKEINILRQELSARSDDLSQRTSELEGLRSEHQELEKQFRVATLEFEVKDQKLSDDLKGRAAEIASLTSDLESTRSQLAEAISDRDARQLRWEEESRTLGEQLERQREERDASVRGLEGRLGEALKRSASAEEEIQRLQSDRIDLETRSQRQIETLEKELLDTQAGREQLRADRDRIALESADRVAEKDAKILGLEQEIASAIERHDKLEADLNAQIQQKLEQLGELEGEVEASRAQLADREQELGAELETLSATKNQLEQQLSTLRTENQQLTHRLTETQGQLSGHQRELENARQQLASTRDELQAEIASLQQDLTRAEETGADLGEQLSATKQELGARVAEVTQLSSQLAEAEDARGDLDERLEALAEQANRREDLLRNDLAARSKELTDAQQKLTGLMQEKQRQVEALTRDAAAKTEQARQFEGKLRAAAQEAKKEQDKLATALRASAQELEKARTQLVDSRGQADATARALAEAQTAGQELSAELELAQQRADEFSGQLERERAERKRLADQLNALSSRSERQIAQATQEAKTLSAELGAKVKEAEEQLANRARKIHELETAVEHLHGAKSRIDKESASRLLAAESKANEAAARLAGVMKDRKEIDGRHLKEMDELTAKHKVELERRDSVRLQEVARLQQAVQEKSKALKVVELELARYRTKATPAAAPTKPPVSGARPISPNAGSASPKTPAPTTKPPVPRIAAASSPARPAAAAASVRPGDGREKVVLPPPEPNSDDDWNVIVDELDK